MTAVTRRGLKQSFKGLKQSFNLGLDGSATSDALHMSEVPAAPKDRVVGGSNIIAAAAAILPHRAAIAVTDAAHAARAVAGCGPVARGAISGATKNITWVFRRRHCW